MSAIARIDWKRIARESADELARLQRELAEARELLGRDIRPLLAGMLEQMPDSLGRRAIRQIVIRIDAAMATAPAPGPAQDGER